MSPPLSSLRCVTRSYACSRSCRGAREPGCATNRQQRPSIELGDDPQLAALARRGIADDPELGLEPVKLALLRFARFVGVALLDRRFLFGLGAEVGDSDAAAEHFIPPQPKLGVRALRQRVADGGELFDELVDGHMVLDVEIFLDASTHCDPPRPRGVKYIWRDSTRNR